MIASGWRDAADDEAQLAWADAFHDAMTPYYRGVYLNYLDRNTPQELVRAAYGVNWDRLRRLKRRYDPDNLFRRNHNIAPLGD